MSLAELSLIIEARAIPRTCTLEFSNLEHHDGSASTVMIVDGEPYCQWRSRLGRVIPPSIDYYEVKFLDPVTGQWQPWQSPS